MGDSDIMRHMRDFQGKFEISWSFVEISWDTLTATVWVLACLE
jgi:hypothetical protein